MPIKERAITLAYELSNAIDVMAREIQPCDPAFVASLHRLTQAALRLGHDIEAVSLRYQGKA